MLSRGAYGAAASRSQTFVRITTPNNLELALEGLVRKVLREQPKQEDIYSFAAEYFETLLEIRDRAEQPHLKVEEICPNHSEFEAQSLIKLATSFPKPDFLTSTSSVAAAEELCRVVDVDEIKKLDGIGEEIDKQENEETEKLETQEGDEETAEESRATEEAEQNIAETGNELEGSEEDQVKIGSTMPATEENKAEDQVDNAEESDSVDATSEKATEVISIEKESAEKEIDGEADAEPVENDYEETAAEDKGKISVPGDNNVIRVDETDLNKNEQVLPEDREEETKTDENGEISVDAGAEAFGERIIEPLDLLDSSENLINSESGETNETIAAEDAERDIIKEFIEREKEYCTLGNSTRSLEVAEIHEAMVQTLEMEEVTVAEDDIKVETGKELEESSGLKGGVLIQNNSGPENFTTGMIAGGIVGGITLAAAKEIVGDEEDSETAKELEESSGLKGGVLIQNNSGPENSTPAMITGGIVGGMTLAAVKMVGDEGGSETVEENTELLVENDVVGEGGSNEDATGIRRKREISQGADDEMVEREENQEPKKDAEPESVIDGEIKNVEDINDEDVENKVEDTVVAIEETTDEKLNENDKLPAEVNKSSDDDNLNIGSENAQIDKIMEVKENEKTDNDEKNEDQNVEELPEESSMEEIQNDAEKNPPEWKQSGDEHDGKETKSKEQHLETIDEETKEVVINHELSDSGVSAELGIDTDSLEEIDKEVQDVMIITEEEEIVQNTTEENDKITQKTEEEGNKGVIPEEVEDAAETKIESNLEKDFLNIGSVTETLPESLTVTEDESIVKSEAAAIVTEVIEKATEDAMNRTEPALEEEELANHLNSTETITNDNTEDTENVSEAEGEKEPIDVNEIPDKMEEENSHSSSKESESVDDENPFISAEVKTLVETQKSAEEVETSQEDEEDKIVPLNAEINPIEEQNEGLWAAQMGLVQAAMTIQKNFRRYLLRKRNDTKKMDSGPELADETAMKTDEMTRETSVLNESMSSDSSLSSSATKIQQSDHKSLKLARRNTAVDNVPVHSFNEKEASIKERTKSFSVSHGARDSEVWSTLEHELESAATTIQNSYKNFRSRQRLRREDAVQITTTASEDSNGSPKRDGLQGTGELHDVIVPEESLS